MSAAEEARLERRAVKIVGYTFFVLAAYVLYESLEKLIFQEAPAPSLLGICIALASMIVMPGLFSLKYRTGKSLGSASLMADSKQTLACAMLSVALLIGLGLNYWFGIWQADPGIGLVIVVLLVREGYHTLKEEKLCSCASCGAAPVPRTINPPEAHPARWPPVSRFCQQPEINSGFYPHKIREIPNCQFLAAGTYGMRK